MAGARYGAAMCLALGLSDLVWLNGSLAPRLVAPAHASDLDVHETASVPSPALVREPEAPEGPQRATRPGPARTSPTRWILILSSKDPADVSAPCAEIRDALARDVEVIVVASIPAGADAQLDRKLVARLAEVLGPEGIPWSRVRVQASLRKDRSIELELGRIGE